MLLDLRLPDGRMFEGEIKKSVGSEARGVFAAM
jgi:hypothetical protein